MKAFGLRACEQGIRMRYACCVDLVDDLHAGLADGTYARHPGAGTPGILITSPSATATRHASGGRSGPGVGPKRR
ncbi:MAG: hypothetical protein ABIY55_28320 [Kofleriaceae bacterium]